MIAGDFPDNPYQMMQAHLVVTAERDTTEDQQSDTVDWFDTLIKPKLEALVDEVFDKTGVSIMITYSSTEGTHISS